ncbi:2'-5' RNA ligase [Clostridium bovifaecis]|uniref:2'-5' RNA ligase n=1 Tax=Clostridium bovifaecis TaxID=2184719 RepID=A0A6I6EWC2_9CLOT|nr:2'-5' RNA ligase [Clostridium bovifaecis]
MKYHLVALFDKESNKLIETTQRDLCRKYKLYKTNQQFYIHIQTIIDPDMDKLNKIVIDTLAPYKKFKVQLNPKFYFDKSQKTINLKVEHSGYITRIIRNITDTLVLSGFNIQNDFNKDLCMPLANSNYSIRKALGDDLPTAFTCKGEDICYDFARINRLELWKPITNKKEVLVKDYHLREY